MKFSLLNKLSNVHTDNLDSNQSYANLRQANQSFAQLRGEANQINKDSFLPTTEVNVTKSSFSWDNTWYCSAAQNPSVSLKTRYYKGKMYVLDLPHTAQPRIKEQKKQHVNNLLDSAMLFVTSFSACSFCAFIFAIYLRVGI
jgi:hypothetical protein